MQGKSTLINWIAIGAMLLVWLLGSCAKDDEVAPIVVDDAPPYPMPTLPETPYDYANNPLPEHITSSPFVFFDNTPDSNPTTDEGATLGRVLFYDKMLSVDNTVACASCHHPEKAFTDGLALSEGIGGQVLSRNSMTLGNHRYGFRLFWDASANTLEQQALIPIQNPLEMGLSLDSMVQKLSALPYYPPLFFAAFADSTITSDRVADALAQFMRAIYTYQSKYDIGVANDFSNFTEEELLGQTLFFSNELLCAACHIGPFFTGAGQPLHNGLDSDPVDIGYGDVTGNQADVGKFKTPTLRNVGLTGPYMHDGRFATLEEVVEHYNSGLQPHPNLDDRLTTTGEIGGPPKQLNMTADHKAALVAFMHTLTDEVFTNDPKYQNPFE